MTAFALGAVAAWMALLVGGLALGVAAQAGGWTSFQIGFGPLTIIEFTRRAHVTSTSFGVGILAAALAAGALNAAAASWLRRRIAR